jgi:hypothetical protein
VIVVEILLVLAVMAAVGYPIFVQPKPAVVVEDGDAFHKLVVAKESAYVALKDLEFDYKTGKLDEEDYDQLKSRYEAEAVSVLKQMDVAQKKGPVSKEGGEQSDRQQKAGGVFCTSCGTQASAADKFCRSCGTRIER